MESSDTEQLIESTDDKEKGLFKKAFNAVECFLERIVTEKKVVLTILSCWAFFILPLLQVAIGVRIYFEEINTDYFLSVIRGVSWIVFVVSSVFNYSSSVYKDYVYRPHFYNIFLKKYLLRCICVLVFAATARFERTAKYFGFALVQVDIPESFDTVIFGFFVNLFFALLCDVLHAQLCTKLRFDPTQNNKNYMKHTWLERNTGEDMVVEESSAFKIVLRNYGPHVWESRGFELTRSTEADVDVVIPLPEFQVLPMESVELVPESFAYEGQCVRVPGFHCFGMEDVSSFVETRIVIHSRFRMDDDLDNDTLSNILEIYDKQEGTKTWENVTIEAHNLRIEEQFEED